MGSQLPRTFVPGSNVPANPLLNSQNRNTRATPVLVPSRGQVFPNNAQENILIRGTRLPQSTRLWRPDQIGQVTTQLQGSTHGRCDHKDLNGEVVSKLYIVHQGLSLKQIHEYLYTCARRGRPVDLRVEIGPRAQAKISSEVDQYRRHHATVYGNTYEETLRNLDQALDYLDQKRGISPLMELNKGRFPSREVQLNWRSTPAPKKNSYKLW